MFPVMVLKVVDFPEPFGPNKPNIYPFSTPKVVPYKALNPLGYILYNF